MFHTQGDANTVADPEDKFFPGQVGIVRVTLPIAGTIAGAMQAYWRLALTLIAAITFFSCAGALVLKKKEQRPVPAPVQLRQLRQLRPVLVTVNADEAWSAHLAWLAAQRRARVA